MNPLTKKVWSPYLVGVLIGLLACFSFWSVDKPLGITGAFEYAAALIERTIAPQAAFNNEYFANPDHKPMIDWEWTLVLGIFIGAFLSAWLAGDRTAQRVPELWRERFGGSTAKRFTFAFLGGALMMFGARLAQGCTTGHGISGAMQLAVSSWLFIIVLFGTGILTALFIYRHEGGDHV